jgi:hypothetical protein
MHYCENSTALHSLSEEEAAAMVAAISERSQRTAADTKLLISWRYDRPVCTEYSIQFSELIESPM